MTEALRRKLTNAGRVLASQDQGDFVAGHVTVRLPDDPQCFLMKPATIGLDEMTPDTIITVDLEGRKVSGTMPRHNEVFIHSEVLRARPDVQAVVHTHAPHAVAFSSLGRELVPVSNEAGYFYKKLPVFAETTDLIVTPDRGKAVARCLGPHGAAILRNHGIVTAGRTIEEAVWLALKLERACRVNCWRNARAPRSSWPMPRTWRARTGAATAAISTITFSTTSSAAGADFTASPTTPAAPSATRPM